MVFSAAYRYKDSMYTKVRKICLSAIGIVASRPEGGLKTLRSLGPLRSLRSLRPLKSLRPPKVFKIAADKASLDQKR